MDQTPRLSLPYIAPQQAQKQVTFNTAMRLLDLFVQPVVKSRSLADPPADPTPGDAYLVAAAPTAGWAGMAGKLAFFVDGGWLFRAPHDGWLLFVDDETAFIQRLAGSWNLLPSGPETEEGIWTPGITFGGAAVGVTYGAGNAGRFTRIGRLCIASFLLQLSSKGSSAGAAQLTGLPFPALASSVPFGLNTGWATAMAGVSGTVQGTLAGGASNASLYGSNGGLSVALSNGNFSNATQIQGFVTYDADA